MTDRLELTADQIIKLGQHFVSEGSAAVQRKLIQEHGTANIGNANFTAMVYCAASIVIAYTWTKLLPPMRAEMFEELWRMTRAYLKDRTDEDSGKGIEITLVDKPLTKSEDA